MSHAPLVVDGILIQPLVGMPNAISIDADGNLITGLTFTQLSSTAHTHNDLYYTKAEVNNLISGTTSGATIAGCLWMSNVTATIPGKVISNKILEQDNLVLSSFTTDDNNVTFTINALPGYKHYKPTVTLTVNGTSFAVPLTLTADHPQFSGTLALNLSGASQVSLNHEDGATNIVNITYDIAPTILDAYFSGDYPSNNLPVPPYTSYLQTELRATNTMTMVVEADMAVNSIILSGAAVVGATYSVVAATAHTFTVTVSSASGFQGATLQVQKASGSISTAYVTWNGVDPTPPLSGGTHKKVLFLNQTSPTVSISAPVYPSGQGAIKNDETVTLVNAASDCDYILYTSSANVSITGTTGTTVDSPKTVQRVSGSYETGTLTLTAYRMANYKSTSASRSLQITNVAPTAGITENYTQNPLRSASAMTYYPITVVPNQTLLVAPTLVASAGTFTGVFVPAGANWSKNLGIDDTMEKGTYPWTHLTLTGLSLLTGASITTNDTYTIEGFLTRRITFPRGVRNLPLGTYVVNTANLSCLDFNAKVFVYQSDKTNNLWGYTITDSLGNLDPIGNFIYICDTVWVETNGSGFSYVDIQELA